MPLFRDSSIRRKLSTVIFFTSLLGLSIAALSFEIYERASFRTLCEEIPADCAKSSSTSSGTPSNLQTRAKWL